MNTYNENLRNSVLVSLQSLELEKLKIKGQLSAAMFTLYYAEGATITANERLLEAESELRFKGKVRKQAVKAGNVSNNLMLAENTNNTYLKQSVTNASVAAANVQVAANAILKLASDMGGIFSIVNAADYHTDIYKQAKAARDYMNDTAYAAEFASQLAMETTMLTSEVSYLTVLDDAKSMSTQMNNLLKLISADYDAAAQLVTNDNAFVATTSAEEKKAEGVLEDISVEYQATNAAYNTTVSNLNLGLTATAGDTNGKNKDTDFTVMFNLLTSPFEEPYESALYPVKEYRIIIVKDSNKTTFDLSAAESLLSANDPHQCIPVGPDPNNVSHDIIASFNIYNDHLVDADGSMITVGSDYAIFVLAVLRDDYKKRINNFDDYLSAPSGSFGLSIVLPKAKGLTTNVTTNTTAFHVNNTKDSIDYKVEYRCVLLPIAAQEQTSTKDLVQSLLQLLNINQYSNELLTAALIQKLKAGNITLDLLITSLLELIDKDLYLDEIQVIKLLEDRKPGLVPKEMLTSKLLKTLDSEISELEQIADKFDPLIAAAEQELIDKEPELQNRPADDIDPFEKLRDGNNSLLKLAKAYQKHHHYDEDPAKEAFNEALSNLDKLVAEKKAALQKVQTDINTDLATTGTPAFFFNLEIAEHIPTGDYILATPAITSQAKEKTKTYWQFSFGNNPGDANARLVTDIFGNLLVEQKEYLPVVVSYSVEPGEKGGQFENNISHIRIADKFTFKNISQ